MYYQFNANRNILISFSNEDPSKWSEGKGLNDCYQQSEAENVSWTEVCV